MNWDVDTSVVLWDEDNVVKSEWDESNVEAFKEWPTEGKRIALVDADMFPYIVGYCCSEEDWFTALKEVEGLEVRSKEWYEILKQSDYCRGPIAQLNTTVNKWIRAAGADAAKFYLTDGDRQYRFQIAMTKEYKAGPARKKPKPPFFHFLKMYVEVEYGATVAYDCEADDLMSIEQWQRNEDLTIDGIEQGDKKGKKFSNTIIVTKDKDLRMIAGWHSNPNYEDGKPFWVTHFGTLEPEYDKNRPHIIKELRGTGMMFFYAQMLMGDHVDNYGGCPRVGKTGAYKLLKDAKSIKEMHKIVQSRYKIAYGESKFDFKAWDGKTLKGITWKDFFVEQGRMAWMQTKHGEMWQPKHKLPRKVK